MVDGALTFVLSLIAAVACSALIAAMMAWRLAWRVLDHLDGWRRHLISERENLSQVERKEREMTR